VKTGSRKLASRRPWSCALGRR